MVFRSFRLHCRRASFLSVSRLGCGTVFVRLLRPFLVFRGFRRQRFESFSGYGFVAFLGRFGLGFRWRLGLFGSTADELHFCLCLG